MESRTTKVMYLDYLDQLFRRFEICLFFFTLDTVDILCSTYSKILHKKNSKSINISLTDLKYYIIKQKFE